MYMYNFKLSKLKAKLEWIVKLKVTPQVLIDHNNWLMHGQDIVFFVVSIES